MTQFASKPTTIPGQVAELKSADGWGIAGAVEAIQKTAAEAAKEHRVVEFVHPPLEPAHIYRVKHGESLSDIIEARPAPRQHTLEDLAAVVDFLKRHGGENTFVWVGPDAVVVVVDDGTRRDRATSYLRTHPQFATVKRLDEDEEGEMHNQIDFLRLLRIDLKGTHASHPNLIQKFKQVKASSGNQSEGDVGHGAFAMSRAAQAKVTGTDELPEELVLDLSVYENSVGGKCAVKCAIEIDPTKPEFGIKPYPGEVADAIYGTRKTIVNDLREELKRVDLDKVTVLLGSP